MLKEIFYALIQSATEFLPISSSGHLSLVSNIIDKPDLFFFTFLHLASLLAVLIFTRKQIFSLLKFDSASIRLLSKIIIATIPAGLFGFFFHKKIEQMFSSYLFLFFAFLFTGIVLLITKFKFREKKPSTIGALFIGLMQSIALFPGVSRSGMTISAGIFSGMKREDSFKFSFLLFIPLTLGAFLLEIKNFYMSSSMVVGFIVCFVFSLIFLNLLNRILLGGNFWIFSIYCFILSIICLLLAFF
jgi:undecaprenyl-diphosphatase